VKRCLLWSGLCRIGLVPAACAPRRTLEGSQPYAPALAHEGAGFKEEYFENLFPSRAGNSGPLAQSSVVWGLKKYCPHLQTFLEIGCGTGFVLSGLPERSFCCPLWQRRFVSGLAFASARIRQSNSCKWTARSIPFVDEYDAIGAFDVLEHIEEDRRCCPNCAMR